MAGHGLARHAFLREHGVRFGALTVPELTRDEKRRAVAKGLFAVLVPAAYLYFAYRIP